MKKFSKEQMYFNGWGFTLLYRVNPTMKGTGNCKINFFYFFIPKRVSFFPISTQNYWCSHYFSIVPKRFSTEGIIATKMFSISSAHIICTTGCLLSIYLITFVFWFLITRLSITPKRRRTTRNPKKISWIVDTSTFRLYYVEDSLHNRRSFYIEH